MQRVGLGIDPGGTVSWAVVVPDGDRFKVWTAGRWEAKADFAQASLDLHTAARAIREVAGGGDLEIVAAVENPAVPQYQKTWTAAQLGIYTGLSLALAAGTQPSTLHFVQPSVWKRAVAATRATEEQDPKAASREAARRWLSNPEVLRWGRQQDLDHNACDAALLAVYGLIKGVKKAPRKKKVQR